MFKSPKYNEYDKNLYRIKISKEIISNKRNDKNYIPPELKNRYVYLCSYAGDIYALGCILYEVYTKRRLFEYKDKEKMIENNYKGIFEIDDLNRCGGIEYVIRRMLDKDCEKRNDVDIMKRMIGITEKELSDSLFRVRNTYNSKTVKIYHIGEIYRKWIFLTIVDMCDYPEVEGLYYGNSHKDNTLVAVDIYDENMSIEKAVEIKAVDNEFIQKYGECDWWYNEKKGYTYVPVYQMAGYNPKPIFKMCVPIINHYKDIINNLYYSRKGEGLELLSVDKDPEVIDGKNKKGIKKVEGIDEDYMNMIRKYEWWLNFN